MDANFIVLTIKHGIEQELKRRSYEPAKTVFIRISNSIEHTEGVKVSPAWIRSALSNDFSPRLFPAIAAFNGIKKIIKEQEAMEKLEKDHEAITAKLEPDNTDEKESEPLIYFEMLRQGKL